MHSESGFSLVECLAALMVFSLAAIGLMQAGSQSVRTANALDERFAANLVASNVMAFSLAAPNSATLGDDQGTERQLGREFSWQRRVIPLEAGLVQIQVTVTEANSGQRLSDLSALRRAQ